MMWSDDVFSKKAWQAISIVGISSLAALMLAKKRRIKKRIVCGPWDSYEEAMAAYESLLGEYEAIKGEGNWELKELTLPAKKVGPTGLGGGYAFTIVILGYPPSSKYNAETTQTAPWDEVGHLANPDSPFTRMFERGLQAREMRDIFDWINFIMSVGEMEGLSCAYCSSPSYESELALIPHEDGIHMVICCDDCYYNFTQEAEGYEVSFNTAPGALDFFPTSTGQAPFNYLDVEKEYAAEENERFTEGVMALKKYVKMTLGVTIPGINSSQRDAARNYWEWFDEAADEFYVTEVGDYECTYFTPEIKQCFYNAFMTLPEIEGAKYYEGYATALSGVPIPVEHAWLVTKEGQVIDTTFALLEREYGHDKSEVVYVGVEIPLEYLTEAVFASSRAGPFIRNYWADVTDSGIDHDYKLYFAESYNPSDYDWNKNPPWPPRDINDPTSPYRYPRDKPNPYEPWKDTNPEDEMWDKLREQARSIKKKKWKAEARAINYPYTDFRTDEPYKATKKVIDWWNRTDSGSPWGKPRDYSNWDDKTWGGYLNK